MNQRYEQADAAELEAAVAAAQTDADLASRYARSEGSTEQSYQAQSVRSIALSLAALAQLAVIATKIASRE